MRPVWQALAWTGGVLGAAVTTAAVGVAANGARNRRNADPDTEEPLGELRPDRQSTVVADDGVPLAVQEIEPESGTAELTAVLVHGYALDSRCWHFQRRDLPRNTDPGMRVVLFDQRGHGGSGRSSRENCTIEQTARDLDAVLRATAPHGKLLLAGHSMGGMTIMALAEQQPELFQERVGGVALISTSSGGVGTAGLGGTWLSPRNPLTSGINALVEWQPQLVERVRRGGGRIAWSLARMLAFGERTPPRALVDLVDDMLTGTSIEVVFDFIPTLVAHERAAALAALRHCEVLIVGSTADRVLPGTHSEAIAAEAPDAELLRLDGAGHMTMLEEHEAVTARLTALARRIARR